MLKLLLDFNGGVKRDSSYCTVYFETAEYWISLFQVFFVCVCVFFGGFSLFFLMYFE